MVLLSQTLRIAGHWKDEVLVDEQGNLYTGEEGMGVRTEFSNTFAVDSTLAVPLSFEASTRPFGFSSGSASVSSFFLEMTAGSAPHDSNLLATNFYIEAEARTRFRPESTKLVLVIRGVSYFNYFDEEQDFRLEIRDLTEADNLLSLLDPWDPFDASETPYSHLLTLSLDHEYELRLWGFITSSDAKDAYQRGSVSFHPIPETSRGVTGLLVVGIAFTATRRRWGCLHGLGR